jgi:hypothetical protein
MARLIWHPLLRLYRFLHRKMFLIRPAPFESNEEGVFNEHTSKHDFSARTERDSPAAISLSDLAVSQYDSATV